MDRNTASEHAATLIPRPTAPLWAAVEAILSTTDKAVSVTSLVSAANEAGVQPADADDETLVQADDIHTAVEHLNEHYEHAGSALEAVKVAGGYRLMTRSGFAGVLAA